VPARVAGASEHGPLGLMRAGIRDISHSWRLIRYLVRADLKRTHADSVIGQLWWILDPLLQMGVYFILVSIILQRKTPDYPLFLFAAILPWKWLSTTLNDASLAVVSRQSLIRQVQFPKLVLPTAATIASTVSFGFGLIALAIVYMFFLHRLTPWLLAIPLIAVVQLAFSLALAITISAVNAFYRDVQNVLSHVLRLWFYLSPTLYSLDHIEHQTIRAVLSLNPMAVILDSYRRVIWGTDTTGGVAPDFLGLAIVLALSLGMLAGSILLFKRVETAFARIL
jgi:lipopolysaccharide transport system permease protein/teichoic acid transport system permease protein